YYDYVPNDDSRESYKARTRSGEFYLFQLKQLSPAQNEFQRALQSFPDDATLQERLSFIYGLTSRGWEAIPFRLKLLQQEKFNALLVYLLAMGDRSLENPQLLTEYEQGNPDDPLVQLGLARMEVDQQKYSAAKSRLQKLISVQPALSQAQALLGKILLNAGERDEFARWQQSLSEQDRLLPEIWEIEGQWYQKQGDRQSAIRCYAEAIRWDATNSTACYQLGQLLLQDGKQEAAACLLDYAKKLQEYEGLVKVAYGDKDLNAARKAVLLAEEAGLLWEAYGWSQAVLLLDSQLVWASKVKQELEPRLAELKLTRVVAEKNPISGLNLPTAESMSKQRVASAASGNPKTKAGSSISFQDVTARAGISFQYFNGQAWPVNHHKMYEFTGGGVGVLDFNADGWPDLYLTQGTNWPVNEQQSQYQDRLFLNSGDGTFQDVTRQAGLNETRFSQGVSIGDVNNDGFADIYVGNIGLNRLYLNNGDGTYSESDQAQGTADQWTTSCLIADLNGDSAPEIYAVNYLTGADIFDRVCKNADGSDRSCMPLNFPGAQDQLFSNQQNGVFQNVTAASGIQVSDGKGLGIIAADLHGTGYPDLFIANDAVANFYFVNQGSPKLKFTEQALLSGLALNAEGRTEACMGIAVGDADADGLLDLYVTNYYRETNTFYRQVSPDAFVDETQAANMSDASTYQLGFGTQFLDADLDGLLDLLIVNGHVEDLRAQDVPWQMRPQFMRNQGQGKFQELNSPELGTFFQTPRLGRGVARLDWNRDGREEAAISSIDQPFVLLENTTQRHGHRLVVHLTGTRSSRDAIGTTVRVKLKGQTLVRQLTAGDGYFASNQRVLVFGLGDAEQIESLEVTWPSGLQQQFGGEFVDQEVHLIEGQPQQIRIRSLN
ncbi:MAG: VCBS repeat-containing protein, partial [Planctomycetaceae bacterium]|nr:VCBS repeat-containing protein [Planctomycetaceae bacterium]